MIKTRKLMSKLTLTLLLLAGAAFAQTDPGVQSAGRGTGAALPSVLANDNPGILAFFNDGLSRFQSVESVSGSPTNNNGLGPRFNSNQCSSCHAQPAVGGSGAAVTTFWKGRLLYGVLAGTPPNEVLPEDDAVKRRKARQTKPCTRC